MIGRTHLQDAVPITLGQVIGGWVAQIDGALAGVSRVARSALRARVWRDRGRHRLERAPAVRRDRVEASWPRKPASHSARPRNHVAALSAHDAMAAASGAIRTLAAALMKMANDVRWYASGPRAGIGELRIPENEPGSSIMPGKINPDAVRGPDDGGGAGVWQRSGGGDGEHRRATSS